MQQNYQAFLDRMIKKYEGGYCWDSGDPGGPTKYGVTCYDLAAHRGQKMDSMRRWAPLVQAMPLAEAEAIYWKRYAVPIRFAELPSGVDCCIMDYAVNSGIGRAPKVANSILGLSGSVISDIMITRLKSFDAGKFITLMDRERLNFMHAIRGGSMWAKFGRGWGARVADLDTYCHHIVSKPAVSAPSAPDLSNVPTPKAKVEPRTGKVIVTAGTGAGTAGAAAYADGVPGWMVVTAVGLAVTGAVIYAGYEAYKDHQVANAVHL